MWALFLVLAPAGAQSPNDPAEEVVVEAAPAVGDVRATASQVTVVSVDEKLPASADVAAAVARAPGVVVQRLGGLGDLAQVGIRGGSPRQVEILLDGIPLNPEGGSAVDLSELPLRAFERVEVYRGATPALLGTGALGGAVNLVPSARPAAEVSLSGGSVRTGRITALGSGSAGPLDGWASVDGLTTSGAFRWFDDGATPQFSDDDATPVRGNNDANQLATLVRLGARAGGVRLAVLHGGLVRDEGIPGSIFARPAIAAHYRVSRHLGAARLEGGGAGAVWAVRIHGLHRREVLEDPRGELGLLGARSTESTMRSAGARASARGLVSPAFRLDGAVGGQVDRIDEVDRLGGRSSPSRSRRVGRLAVGATWKVPATEVVLSPMWRALWVSTAGSDGVRPLAFPVLPGIGGRVDVGAVTVKGNVGLSARPPDPLELFGDRGSFIGNPDLRAERSSFVDFGVLGGEGALSGEVVGFMRSVRDLISWAQLPQGVARAENLERAMIAGLETSAIWSVPPFDVAARASVLRAVNRSQSRAVRGAQLPRVPVASGGLRVGWRSGAFGLATDADGSTSAFADPVNLDPLGPRLLWGATATAWSRGDHLSLEFDVRNLMNQLSVPLPASGIRAAMVDFSGYPLPGRTFLVSLRARH